MRQIPILFSIPMVKAIQAGAKTQTRRIIKKDLTQHMIADCKGEIEFFSGAWGCKICGAYHWDKSLKCPYGDIGDILWVKETHYRFGRWKKNGFSEKTGEQKWKFRGAQDGIAIKYMDNPPELVRRNGYRKLGWYKRNSLFMPKTACRLRLQITGLRVERLTTISQHDALAEGIKTTEHYIGSRDVTTQYMYLWLAINGPDSWDKNPWVWVVEFKVKEIKK